MKKIIILSFISLISLFCLFIYQYATFNDGKLHIVFCDVGQGDAIFIRTPENHTILVDGGPDTTVLSCLTNHMPFWQRTISMMLLSHPHADHFTGFLSVVKQYHIGTFGTEKLINTTATYNRFVSLLKEREVPVEYLFAKSSLKTHDNIVIQILSPTNDFLKQTSPNGIVGERAEFASLIEKISYGSFRMVLTGDSQENELSRVIKSFQLSDISVLQIPHHGSKTGTSEKILAALRPHLGVISVGKNNYGHPSQQTINLIKNAGIPFLRTDQAGDIEIVTDGKRVEIKTQRESK